MATKFDQVVAHEEHHSSGSDIEKSVHRSDAGVDLNHNTSAKITNPLAGIPAEELLQDVKNFAQGNDLVDILLLLERGALVAQDPAAFDSVDGITDAEKTALQDEILRKWRQPWTLYLTIALCSIGAAVQGWDQTGSNGANLSFPVEFGIPDSADSPNAARNQWIVGVVNSAPYMASALFSCWLSDPLNNWLGRRPVIFISAIFCCFSVIGSAVTQTWEQLFVTRLLLGVGMGLKGSTIPIFAAENTPAPIRGALVMSWQLWTAFGIFLGCAANMAVKDVGRIAWRLQLGSAFIPAVPLWAFIFLVPESPRYYIKKRMYRKAYNSLVRLRNTELQAARDLYYISYQIKLEKELLALILPHTSADSPSSSRFHASDVLL
ncbi:hypothetical protein CLAIMM_06697 [Cladophialophora immunda]|nr:hypothetical protein CLAIMM_06697 [Cladophialophora immunda]